MDVDPKIASSFSFLALALAVSLFLGMMAFLELGRRIALRARRQRGETSGLGLGVVEGLVHAVLALLLGFMFNGAMNRFDSRRELVTQEVGAISTSWQRIATLPAAAQPTIRGALTRYVDAVVGVHITEPGSPVFRRHAAELAPAQDDLWTRAVAACLAGTDGDKARMLLLPTINELFDVVDRERLASTNHPPRIIYVMLLVAAFAGAMFAGYSMANEKTRNWLFIIGIAATISIVMYVVIELEFPRLGVVNTTVMDRALIDARAALR
jgi:hypothetical protein